VAPCHICPAKMPVRPSPRSTGGRGAGPGLLGGDSPSMMWGLGHNNRGWVKCLTACRSLPGSDRRRRVCSIFFSPSCRRSGPSRWARPAHGLAIPRGGMNLAAFGALGCGRACLAVWSRPPGPAAIPGHAYRRFRPWAPPFGALEPSGKSRLTCSTRRHRRLTCTSNSIIRSRPIPGRQS